MKMSFFSGGGSGDVPAPRARPNKHAISTLPGRKKAPLHFGVRRHRRKWMRRKKLRRFWEGLSFTLTHHAAAQQFLFHP
jgi:hypothetical protein